MAGFRIQVTLDKIVCHQTEDNAGSDEFYVIAALVPKNGKTKLNHLGVWDLNDGQTKEFPNGQEVFDETADEDEYLVLISCWDQDASEDISVEDLKKASEILERVKDEIGLVRLKSGRSSGGGNWITDAIDGIFYLVRLLVRLDKDDFLGKDQQTISVPTDWPMIDNSKAYQKKFNCSADGSNYDVYYTIRLKDV